MAAFTSIAAGIGAAAKIGGGLLGGKKKGGGGGVPMANFDNLMSPVTGGSGISTTQTTIDEDVKTARTVSQKDVDKEINPAIRMAQEWNDMLSFNPTRTGRQDTRV